MKNRTVIGIDIAADEVRGACVRPVGGAPQLVAVASTSIPSGAADAEGHLNAELVGEAIRRVCAEMDPKARQAVVGMTGCSLVARVMEIPPVPDSEVRAVLRGEMDHYRILPAGQSTFDYYRLPDAAPAQNAAPEEAISRVLLMGVEERLVESYRASIDMADLQLAAVEPGSIAAMRALYPTLKSEEAVVIVFVSATGTDVSISQNGELQFFRRVDTGLPELRSLRVTLGHQAESTSQNRTAMLVADDEEEEDATPGAVAGDPYNRQAISLLITEIQRSIDYYGREFPEAGDKMRVCFVLDCADAADMFGVMTQYLRSEAELASIGPALAMSVEADAAMLAADGFRFMVAIGLALRGAGGPFTGAPALNLGVHARVTVERRIAPRLLMTSMAASGVILVGTIAAAAIVGGMIAGANRTLKQTNTELASVTQEHAALVNVLERQKRVGEVIAVRNKPVREAVDFLSAAISRQACFTSMSLDQKGNIVLNGEATSPRVVADLMDMVNMSPMLEPVRLNALDRVGSEDGEQALSFDLQTAFLKPSLPAPGGPGAGTSAGPAAPAAPGGGS